MSSETQTAPARQRSAAPALGGALAWGVWSLSAIAFGYAFFQRVAPSVMVSDLMAEFAVGAAVLGQLSALYFYPYALLQVPIGALLDRYGARLLLTLAMSVAALGSVLFGLSASLEAALLGRFLIGVGSAVGFISSMALAARWFPPHRFAFVTGVSMFFGTTCAMLGQAPLAAAVGAFGWRQTMLAAGLFAAVLAAAIALFVRNAPGPRAAVRAAPSTGVWTSLREAFGRREVWLIAWVAAAMSGPMLAFGGLWSVPYLMAEYDLPRPRAAFLASLCFVGWAAGAPLFGWASDRIRRRRLPLIIGSAALTIAIACLALWSSPPLWLTVLVTFLIGFAGSIMSLSFALAREVTPPEIHGSVLGIVNGLTVGAGAVLQPAIGALLDFAWDGTMLDGARHYAAQDYRFAFLVLLAWAAAGLLATLFLRETHCRPVARVAGA